MAEPQRLPLLEIRNLSLEFATPLGPVYALNLGGLDLYPGEVLGLVGESGSGKSLTASTVLGLLPSRRARVTSGQVLFDGRDLLRATPAELQHIRGRDISMIFQDPMAALNPVFPVGEPLLRILRLHRGLRPAEARHEALRILDEVQIPDPAAILRRYPHELSGGQRQRIMIAMAIAGGPRLLVADEPTTALDVTVQEQVIRLLQALQRAHGTAVLFITHNMGVVARLADRVAVMYGGDVVEVAPVAELFSAPRHPYSRLLLDAIPRVSARRERLPAIGGEVPDLRRRPVGCAFAPRCPLVTARCLSERPSLSAAGAGQVACFHPLAAGDSRTEALA